MADDPIVQLLAKQSAARLRDMDATLSGQITDLQVQQVWVRRALEEKGVTPPTTSPATSEATHGENGSRAKRKRSNKREAIMKVLMTNPNRVWLPSAVKEGLLAEGIDSSVEAVRVTLRRMGDDKELVRPEDGNGWMVADSGAHSNGLEADNALIF
jgi:hypothetical protein